MVTVTEPLTAGNYTRDSRRNASALGTEKGMNQKSDTLRQIDAKESQVKKALTEK